jgi:arylsulfatase A-like enzyme
MNENVNKLLAIALLALCAMPKISAASDRADGDRRYNVIFIISDQETYQLAATGDYQLPARGTLARRGTTFCNHYIASAMCTPSRAAFFTGTPPQVNGVFDQMEYGFVPNLRPDMPNIGSVLRGLGYRTAYFGKFELNAQVLASKDEINYSKALEPYGFDYYSPDGDVPSGPYDGYMRDFYTAGEGVRWLRTQEAWRRERGGQPFFMVVSLLNPHDIMYTDANLRGQPPVQKASAPRVLTPPPADSRYRRHWDFSLPSSLGESLTAPGMPPALLEYHRGWCGALGLIPADRRDMWTVFYDYYLNCIRDNDRALQLVIDAMNEMDLWKDTVVVFTADHGEMAGAHGGLKGKGPFCYEANAHVPLVVVHPEGKPGTKCQALTSHLDLLPTFVGLTGLPRTRRPAAVAALPGRDFSSLLADPEQADVHAVRPAVLFNYVGVSTIDSRFLDEALTHGFQKRPAPPLGEINLGNRGFLSFAFDGRHKFARYYAPDAFNTPGTLAEILNYNDVQLFDLANDRDEVRNLALAPEENKETLVRMNALLNELIAAEVGANDGGFLPKVVRPDKPPLTSDPR